MAALAPRVAYALPDAELGREERAKLRETMNDSLETMNTAAWRRMVRAVGLEPNALSASNLGWCADYMELGDEAACKKAKDPYFKSFGLILSINFASPSRYLLAN